MKIYVIGTGTMAKGIVKAFAAKMPVVMKSRTRLRWTKPWLPSPKVTENWLRKAR